MTHDQPEALEEGHWLSLLGLIGFWGPEKKVRKGQRPLPKPEGQGSALLCWGLHPSQGPSHLSVPARPGSR
jgi:hypothetical protein